MSRNVALIAMAVIVLSCSLDTAVPSLGQAPGAVPAPDGGGPSQELPSPDSGAPPPEPTSGPGLLVSVATETPPNVDDEAFDADEWLAADATGFDIATSALRKKQGSYSFSATVTFASLHTTTDLYFLIDLADDALLADDGVMLMLDAEGDELGPYGVDDHLVWIGPEGLQFMSPLAEDLDFSGTLFSDTDRLIIELRIGKASLGAANLPPQLGFNLAINDSDESGSGYGVWHVEPGARCTSCCQGQSLPSCDTTMLGHLLLQ